MYNQQFNQQLPFSATQLERQYLNIGPNNPPYVPQYNGNPALIPMVGYVAAITALEIQNNATKNPLRTFMYNQYSVNNYANPDFASLVCGVLDFMTLGINKRVYQNEEHAVQVCVPALVEMFCAVNTTKFSGLNAFITDQMMAQSIQNTISIFNNTAAEVNQMKQYGAIQQPQMQPQYHQQPQMQYSQRMPAAQTFTNVPRPVQNYGRHGGMPASVSTSSNSGLFNTGVNIPPPQSQPTGSYGKYANMPSVELPSTPSTVRPSVPPVNIGNKKSVQIRDNQMNNSVQEVVVRNSKIKWKASASQPYFPAYNPITHEAVYVLDANNNILETKIIQRENAIVDYARHETSPIFGKTLRPISFDVISSVKKDVQKLNNAIEAKESNPDTIDPEVITYVDPNGIIELSLQAAWMACEVNRLQAQNGTIPFAFRSWANVGYPIVSTDDHSILIELYGEDKSFIGLAKRLANSVDSINTELWNLFNRRMTKLVNRLLKQDLGIPNLSIDSFVEDVEDLTNHLQNKFNSAFNAFIANQKEHIKNTFSVMDTDSAKYFTNMYLDSKVFHGETPIINYLISNYSLTYLDCTVAELGLELNPDSASVIDPELNPMIYNLLDGLAKDIVSTNSQYSRHLIRCNDLTVLEFTIGALSYNQVDNKPYLLMRVK